MIIFICMLFVFGCHFIEHPIPSEGAIELSETSTQQAQMIFEQAEQIRILLVNDQQDGLVEHAERLHDSFVELAASNPKLHAITERGKSAAHRLQEADSLAVSRAQFAKVSELLITLGGLEGSLQEGRVVFECPMVDYYPKWVQPAGGMENPYMGQAMLVCGVETSWSDAEETESVEDEIAYYTCPMHPDIRNGEQGACPLCSMDLLAVYSADLESGTVLVDGLRRQRIGVALHTAALGTVVSNKPYYATVHSDDSYAHVLSLRFNGWIQSSKAPRVGEYFTQGQILFTVYSPEVYTAQQELLIRSGHQETARRKLQLLGLGKRWIDRVEQEGAAQETVPIFAPIEGVVTETKAVDGKAFSGGESILTLRDLRHIWLDLELYPNQTFAPQQGETWELNIEGLTYSAKVLGELPDRYKDQARIIRLSIEQASTRPLKVGQVVAVQPIFESEPVLRVPADAVIVTGERHIVFVDVGESALQPRDIQVGSRNSDWVEVVSGLTAGERVVSKGVFLIASESRIQSATGFWAGASDAP